MNEKKNNKNKNQRRRLFQEKLKARIKEKMNILLFLYITSNSNYLAKDIKDHQIISYLLCHTIPLPSTSGANTGLLSL
jgi:hypothetical protein